MHLRTASYARTPAGAALDDIKDRTAPRNSEQDNGNWGRFTDRGSSTGSSRSTGHAPPEEAGSLSGKGTGVDLETERAAGDDAA